VVVSRYSGTMSWSVDSLSPHRHLFSPRGILGGIVSPAGDCASASRPSHLGAERVVQLPSEHLLILIHAAERLFELGNAHLVSWCIVDRAHVDSGAVQISQGLDSPVGQLELWSLCLLKEALCQLRLVMKQSNVRKRTM
jgi:hypothetical protein